MLRAQCNNQFVRLSAIDVTALETTGWASFTVPSFAETDLRTQLLCLAAQLGSPIETRTGGDFCETLTPGEAPLAKPRSLSKVHSVGEFPVHADTAHWLTPGRYVMLACIFPGRGNRPTLLLDTRNLPFSARQSSLLHSTPFRVKNGRNSFFSTILSKARRFVRFDPGCMTKTTPDGAAALEILSRHNWPEFVEAVNWEIGRVIVIDNWRLLHGRGRADRLDSDRKLLRVTIR